MSSAARKVSPLRGDGVDLAAAAEDAFLSTARVANPNTPRAYAGAIDRTVALLGPGRSTTGGPAGDQRGTLVATDASAS
jgi:hypothetical protein